jgi:CTP:phosphocholine cytidylyltransferase-like protein
MLFKLSLREIIREEDQNVTYATRRSRTRKEFLPISNESTTIEDVKLGEKVRTKLQGTRVVVGRHHCRRLVSRRRKGGVMVATSS